MKLKSLVNAATSKVGQQLLTAKQHSPSLMFAAGVAGIGVTVVLACRSTLKVEEVLDELEKNLEKVDTVAEAGLSTKNDQHRARVASYVRATTRLAKLYGPALVVGGISIALLTGSHITLKNRLAGTTAALAAVHKTFNAYRERVVNELGIEKDREFRYGVDIEENLVEGENGPEVVYERKAKDGDSMYARWFNCDTSRDWSPNVENNILKLRATQDYANHRLNAKGYVLLNDVYEALGMTPTSAGSQTGWLKDNPRGGDGFVDLGCWSDKDMDAFSNFMWRGRASAVLIDPNVDGEIWRSIDKLEDGN